MAREGWNAKGLLAPLWTRWGGGEPYARERLATAIGTQASVLSAINSGSRQLGHDLAERLARELGVSVLELGAPEGEADQRGLTLLDRLAELAEGAAAMGERLAELEGRVEQLETRSSRRRGGSAGQRVAP